MAATRSDLDYATHNYIIHLMEERGLNTNASQGVCQGISMMGIQAFSTQDGIEKFRELLRFIATLDIAKIESALSQSPVDEKISEVLTLFERIAQYCDPSSISPLPTSFQLDATHDLKKLHSVPGIYTQIELATYLTEWERIANTVAHPLSFLLKSDKHAIAIHYDPEIGDWLVLNSNPRPIIKKRQTALMSGWIRKALQEFSSFTALETTLFFSADKTKSAELDEKIQREIARAEKIEALHTITEEKAKRCNSRKITLAVIAAQLGHAPVIEALRRAGASLNTPKNNGTTPACIAAHQGHVAVLQALASAGVDLSQKIPGIGTPLDLARAGNHRDCVDYLLSLSNNSSPVPRNPSVAQSSLFKVVKVVKVVKPAQPIKSSHSDDTKKHRPR